MKKFASMLVVMTFAGLTYVYSEVEAVKIGYAIRKQEELKVQSLDRTRALKYNIARLKSPHNLERRLLAQKIVLDSPKQWQTLFVSSGPKKVSPNKIQPRFEPPFFTRFFVGTAQAEAKDN